MAKCKVLQVKHCGPIEVAGQQDILDALASINATLQGELTVAPNTEWAALLQTSVEAALATANVDVTITNTDPVSVAIDTTNGPVEVTGNVTITEPLTVAVSNFPTEFAISNFADLEGLELTVTLDGEVVTVTPDAAFVAEFDKVVTAINTTVRVDYEATGMCVFDANGSPIDPPVKQFVERRYSNVGVFLSNDVVLSQYNADGTISGYTLNAGETVAACKSDDSLLQSVVDLLQSVIGDPADPCPCDEVANVFRLDPATFVNNTKYNLDDPNATKAYGDVGNDNWTAADLAASLNTNAALATPANIPSGIDYTTTVWSSGSDATGEYVFVSSGPIPTSLDLVSVPVSIPVSTL